MGPILFYIVFFVFMTWRVFASCVVRPQTATTITFDDTGLSLIRSEPTAFDAYFVFARSYGPTNRGNDWDFRCLANFHSNPRTALPDGGTQLMRFFADRIVSQGISESTSRGVTTLVNSVTPLFTRS